MQELARPKLNSIEVLISTVLIDSNISHDEFALIKNVLRCYDMREEMKITIINKNLNNI